MQERFFLNFFPLYGLDLNLNCTKITLLPLRCEGYEWIMVGCPERSGENRNIH